MKTPSSQNSSRREFLRRLSIGTAAVTTGLGFSDYAQSQLTNALQNNDSPGGQKKLGVALLGLGPPGSASHGAGDHAPFNVRQDGASAHILFDNGHSPLMGRVGSCRRTTPDIWDARTISSP